MCSSSSAITVSAQPQAMRHIIEAANVPIPISAPVAPPLLSSVPTPINPGWASPPCLRLCVMANKTTQITSNMRIVAPARAAEASPGEVNQQGLEKALQCPNQAVLQHPERDRVDDRHTRVMPGENQQGGHPHGRAEQHGSPAGRGGSASGHAPDGSVGLRPASSEGRETPCRSHQEGAHENAHQQETDEQRRQDQCHYSRFRGQRDENRTEDSHNMGFSCDVPATWTNQQADQGSEQRTITYQ